MCTAEDHGQIRQLHICNALYHWPIRVSTSWWSRALSAKGLVHTSTAMPPTSAIDLKRNMSTHTKYLGPQPHRGRGWTHLVTTGASLGHTFVCSRTPRFACARIARASTCRQHRFPVPMSQHQRGPSVIETWRQHYAGVIGRLMSFRSSGIGSLGPFSSEF